MAGTETIQARPTPTQEQSTFITYRVPEHYFFMALTPAAHNLARSVGWSAARRLVEAALEEAMADPFGPNCIDHFAGTDAGRTARTVTRLSGEAEAAFGLPVAVKGTGRNEIFAEQYLGHRAGLAEQFKFMHGLYVAQQAAHPGGVGGLVAVNRPLAYIAHNPAARRGQRQEWLLMDRIAQGEPVREFRTESRRGSGFSFSGALYPDLAAFAGHDPAEGPVDFADVRGRLSEELATHTRLAGHLGDVVGHNLLRQFQDNDQRYVLIDAQPD